MRVCKGIFFGEKTKEDSVVVVSERGVLIESGFHRSLYLTQFFHSVCGSLCLDH